MNDYYSRLNRNNSAFQAERLSPVIRPDYIPVDERDLSQLLLILCRYAENLHYYNHDNKQQGTWLTLFRGNDILLLASAILFDANKLRNDYLAQRKMGLNSHIAAVMRQVTWLDQWCSDAEKLTQERGRRIFVKIKNMLCNKCQQHVVDSILLQDQKNKNSVTMESLCHFWASGRDKKSLNTEYSRVKKFSRHQKDTLLQETFDKLLSARLLLSREASTAFQDLLTEQKHNSATSMLLAFLKAYRKSQSIINEYPEKLIRFYYRQVLHNHPKPGLGDSVILHGKKIPNNKPLLIPKGHLFNAGKTEELKNLLYVSANDSVLTGAQLSAVKTIYLQRDGNVSPENVTTAVTQIKSMDLSSSGSSKEGENALSSKVSVFGYDDNCLRKKKSNQRVSKNKNDDNNQGEKEQDDSYGLYITSSLLYLKEGERRISLKIEFADVVLDRIESLRFKSFQMALFESRNALPCSEECHGDCKRIDGIHYLDGIDSQLFHMAFSLYHCLPWVLRRNRDAVLLLKQFCETLGTDKLVSWQMGGRTGLSHLLKAMWIYLYTNSENHFIVGAAHKELISRKIMNPSYLSDSDQQRLLDKISLFSPSKNNKNNLVDMKKDIERSSFALLIYYFSDAFDFKLTQEQGWLVKRNYLIEHLSDEPVVSDSAQLSPDSVAKKSINKRERTRSGFIIEFELGAEVAPIVAANPQVHGAENTTALPVLLLRINPLSKIFPYSFLSPFLIKSANLSVNVSGFRDLSIHNEYGKVDNNKPFMPFSAIPKQDARFYLGGYEYAKKNVTQLGVTFSWKNLPNNYGGFAQYYQAYGSGMANSDYKVNVTMLANGHLQPRDESLQQVHDLFSASSNTDTLYAKTHIDYHYTHANSKINENVSKQEYEALNEVEHAYLCFRLRATKKVFGHEIYPTLLGDTLAKNSRRRKQLLLPEQPYTPEIERVDIQYTAQEPIHFATSYSLLGRSPSLPKGGLPSNGLTLQGEGVASDLFATEKTSTLAYYKTPLGIERAHVNASLSGSPLLPQWQCDGNLYIGFSCADSSESLCIYFQLNNDSTHPAGINIEPLQWHYYSPLGWRPMEQAKLLSDSTHGLIHSGIVTLHLPEDLYAHPGLQPVGQYWLRISTTNHLRHYATLNALCFDAVLLNALDNDTKLSSQKTQGFSSQWRTAYQDIPEVQSWVQTQAAFANADVEKSDESRVRLYERLRHKNRALCPWDYERIVLENFPEVDMVKCLPACRFNDSKPAPGHVLVVVMPRLLDNNMVHNQGHHLNSVVLGHIADTLQRVSPPNISLNVINACYEYVQVRCAVRFKNPIYQGERLKQLQMALSDYVSPWSKKGNVAKLGWIIRTKEVEAFISKLPYISLVTKVSLVKCYSDNHYPDYFRLEDTAKPHFDATESPAGSSFIQAEYPWSLPLPSRHHHIEILRNDVNTDLRPIPVGISRLEIGNTFVLRKSSKEKDRNTLKTQENLNRDQYSYVETQ